MNGSMWVATMPSSVSGAVSRTRAEPARGIETAVAKQAPPCRQYRHPACGSSHAAPCNAMPATAQTTRRRGNRFPTLLGESMDLISTAPHYTGHWDEKFRSRSWGRYPPEDLVRFMGRRFRAADKGAVKVLEVGCGPGANLWFMHREGFAVHGIDIS